MAISSLAKSIYIFLIILSIIASQALSESDECSSEESNDCNDKAAAGPLKIIAIATILISSIIGVCAPLLTKSVPALHPDKDIFVIVKLFGAGIILATGFMHVLPDSAEMLSSSCLPETWQNFPFTFFVAMLSVLATLLIDSFATSFYSRKPAVDIVDSKSDHEICIDQESCSRVPASEMTERQDFKQLVRYRVIAMVLELGIIVHSVVIGLSLGASNNTCTIKSLVAAMCFHQMFEGMGLGGSILQAEFKFLKKAAMAFFFSVTTPFGIALGMALTKAYKENSPTALITVGLLNAISAGLLIYMALVNLLAVEFMGPKLQGSTSLQFKSIAAVSLGAASMSVLAYWA